jgi:dipeptidyl-peptidase-3
MTQSEVTSFYANMGDKKDETPPSYGLNTKLMKETDKVYRKDLDRPEECM